MLDPEDKRSLTSALAFPDGPAPSSEVTREFPNTPDRHLFKPARGAAMTLLRTIEHQHVKPFLRRMLPYRETAYAELRVSYKRHLDGGGSTFGQDFLPLLRRRGMPKAARAFEWCAGPGFIGFSLLANGLCDTLCLADVNPEAVAACRRTVASNRGMN